MQKSENQSKQRLPLLSRETSVCCMAIIKSQNYPQNLGSDILTINGYPERGVNVGEDLQGLRANFAIY